MLSYDQTVLFEIYTILRSRNSAVIGKQEICAFRYGSGLRSEAVSRLARDGMVVETCDKLLLSAKDVEQAIQLALGTAAAGSPRAEESARHV